MSATHAEELPDQSSPEEAAVGTGRWVSAGLFLIVVSALATLGWFGYRWWRRRRLLAKSAVGRPSLEV